MDSDIRHLSCGPEAVEHGRSVQIGHDAAREVMGGRSDRKPIDRRIESGFSQLSRDRRESIRERFKARRVEPAVLHPEGIH